MSAAAVSYPAGGTTSYPSTTPSSTHAGERVFAHIDDLKAQAREGYNPYSTIPTLLNVAETALNQAHAHNTTFRRPDRAFVEFLRASDIVVDIIPRHKDYPSVINSVDHPEQTHKYRVLKGRVNASTEQYGNIKQIIISNNKRNGTRPRGAAPPDEGHVTVESAPETNGNHAFGDEPDKVKPVPSPKPEKLNGKAISPALGSVNGSGPNIDALASRFASLRRSATDAAESVRSSTSRSPVSMPAAADFAPQPRSSFDIFTSRPPKPNGPRGMPDGNSTPPPSISTPVPGLPQAPPAAYSPARNMNTAGDIAPPRHSARSLASSSTRRSSMAPTSSASSIAPNGAGASGEYFPSPSANGAVRPSRSASLHMHQDVVISPERLFDYLERYYVLLIDFRTRDQFDKGHIYHRNVMCVEPMTVRESFSAEQLFETLVLSPDNEVEMFNQRDQFDLVVYYDTDTQAAYPFQELTSENGQRLRRLHQTLWDFNQEKPLRNCPVLLRGGIEAWIDLVGRQALMESNTLGRVKSARPIARRPLATARANGTSNLSVPRRRVRNYNPLDEEEENKWRERARAESVVLPHAPVVPDEGDDEQRLEGLDGGEEGVESAIREFNARFPDAGNLDALAFASQQPTRLPPAIPPKIPEYPPPPPASAFPQAPARPAPAAPRMSYTGVSDRAVSAATPQSRTPSGQLSAYVSPKYLAANLRLPRTGIINFGNTCYMNAPLQALSATLPLSTFFMDDAFKTQLQRDNWRGSKGVMTEIYVNVVRSLWKGDVDAIRPLTLRSYVKRICDAFNNDDQQDAKEFLELLLDQLHEDVNTMWSRTPLKALTPEQEARRESMPTFLVAKTEWDRFTHRSLSFVQGLFAGQHASKLTCLTCAFTSTTYEAFTALSVEIPPKSGARGITLDDCLRSYCSEEQLLTDNAWHCPRCKTTRDAAKRITLTRAPQFLVVHFKRFATNGPSSTFSLRSNKGTARKISTPVDFPLNNFDLGPYMLPAPSAEEAALIARLPHGAEALRPHPATTGPFRYDCYAVVRHLGATEKSGHYMCAARDQARKCWRLYNDSQVMDFQPEEGSSTGEGFGGGGTRRLQSGDAYIVFYQRIGGTTPLLIAEGKM